MDILNKLLRAEINSKEYYDKECLNTDNIILCETKDNIIEKMEGKFKYKLREELIDRQKGIVEVKGFHLHIDEDKIPKDISNGMCIQSEVSRIDIW